MGSFQLYYTDSLASSTLQSRDGFMIAYDPSFSLADSDDVPKLGNLDENFSIFKNAKTYSMELTQLPKANDTIFIRVNQYTTRNYTIRLNWLNKNLAGLKASLYDRYTNTNQEIAASGNTDFSYTVDPGITASVDPLRFYIVFAANPLSTGSATRDANPSFTVYPNPVSNGTVQVVMPEDGAVKIFDTHGRMVQDAVLKQGKNTIDVSRWSKSLYYIRNKWGHIAFQIQ